MSGPPLATERDQQPRNEQQQDQVQEQQQPVRACPACGGTDTRFVQRGYAGATDERDQYYICEQCGHTTYEIVSRTVKEIRIGRLETGRQTRIAGSDYIVTRVLKAGVTESLVYLKPIPPKPDISRPQGRLTSGSR